MVSGTFESFTMSYRIKYKKEAFIIFWSSPYLGISPIMNAAKILLNEYKFYGIFRDMTIITKAI